MLDSWLSAIAFFAIHHVPWQAIHPSAKSSEMLTRQLIVASIGPSHLLRYGPAVVGKVRRW